MFRPYLFISACAFTMLSLTNAVNAQSICKPGTPRFEISSNVHEDDYLSKTIIFKIKPEYRNLCSSTSVGYPLLKAFMQQMGVQNFKKIYPNHQQPVRAYNERGQKVVDLSLLYQYTYTANIPLQKALIKIAALGIFEYAEPYFIPKTFYVANDSLKTSQYHTALMKADKAWDVAKGDTNVVVGIVDTGTDPTHPDLKGNIKYNYNDKVDGIDNDNDGYTDNFTGWDLGLNDNDPTWQGDAHGVHVCGIASASTDNSIGVTGVGFKCKFLPIKIANATGTLTASYQGITYGADHGCKVINCSWGGVGGGQYGQDIINYATYNKDVLVVVAAGNNGNESILFPGAYQNVLCVAATNSSDILAGYSNFGYGVGISAPGDNIYSTYSGGGYVSQSGTSMASPNTAGAAALVRAYFPAYTAGQTAQRLRVTADHIDSLNSGTLKNKLGTGRVNLYRALVGAAVPSVSMTTRTITDGNDGAPVAGDTLRISGIFTNFLAPTSNLTATLTTANTYVKIITGTTAANLGSITTLGTGNNISSPFKVQIKSFAPLNTVVTFKITYIDGTYSAVEFFDVVVNVDYLNIAVNDVATSMTSKGMIGFNNTPPTLGLGFAYNNSNLMYDCGLLIGAPDSSVSDVIRGITTNNKDFVSTVNIQRISTGAISDFDTQGYMKDSPAPKALPVLVHSKTYAWSTPGDNKYVIINYIILNNGSTTLNGIYTGLCADWDIQAAAGDSNRVSFDAGNRMAYTFCTRNNGYYAGIKLLSHTAAVNAYGFDNKIGGGGGINIYDAFSEAEKYTALSTMRTDAGTAGGGTDVLSMVSSGPFAINAGDSIQVAFALIAGDNLSDLQSSAVSAQTKYNNMLVSSPTLKAKEGCTLQFFPNPASGNTTIDINLPQATHMNLKLYNMIGQDVATIATGEFSSGKHQFSLDVSKLNSGVYYYQLLTGETKLIRKLIVSK